MNTATDRADMQHVLRRVSWRILPLLLLLYFIAYLDRINISFAAASMQRDLHFSDALYGTGAGLFFLGALLAQLPSNLLFARVGARRTIAGLMLAWGCTSASIAFVHTPAAFLTLRFLLGAAEAGFYPGVIFYLTLWLPRRVRTSAIAWFLFAIPLASIFGGPLSTWILQLGPHGGFADWQQLLLMQAAPAVLIGVALPWLLSDSPAQAAWLSDQERTLLERARAEDEPPAISESQSRHAAIDFGSLPHLLLFAAIYFAMQFGLYAQSFWLPRVLQGLGVAKQAAGWHVSLVYIGAALLMIGWGYVTDRAPTRRWTLIVPLLFSAFGYAATSLGAHHLPGFATMFVVLFAFSMGSAGALAATPPFWAQVTLGQRAASVAAMVAIINALGNLGGFAGPSALGVLYQHTHTYTAGMMIAGAGMACAASLLLVFQRIPANSV
jgi:ACS family tartrate transporter-like MFS transporter